MACSIILAITIRLVKYYAELLTRYSKYGALKVLENKLIIFCSNKGGLICATASCHLKEGIFPYELLVVLLHSLQA
jgi:hypothetical protein